MPYQVSQEPIQSLTGLDFEDWDNWSRGVSSQSRTNTIINSEFELKILRTELMKTGKTRSEIVRGLIADLGRKQAKQNKAA